MSGPTSPDLPGLPGASRDPGTGPVVEPLLDALLDDAAALAPGAPPMGQVLERHRTHRASWYADLVGPLLVPASAAAELADALTSADHGLRVALVGDPGAADDGDPGERVGRALTALREARNTLGDDARVDLVSVEIALPADVPPAAGVPALLDALDFTVPAFVDLPTGEGWRGGVDALADDGAEQATLRVGGVAGGTFVDEARAAAFLRHAVDRDVPVRVDPGAWAGLVRGEHLGGEGDGAQRHGVLNLVAAVRAALNGAEAPEVSGVLAERDPALLASAARRMSEADAAVARAFLLSVVCRSVAQVVDELVALGLVGVPEA